jgi:hypothetical protein
LNGKTAIPLCFLTGTLIRTPSGEVAVETLAIGDEVLTDEGPAAVRWVGRQTVAKRFSRSLPVRISAGALAENVPARDLFVSPQHALLFDGLLVQAGTLVNGTTITHATDVPETFVYYNLEFDRHAVVYAEGAAAESFVDNAERENFDNWAEHEALYGHLPPLQELPYPVVKAARQVPARLRACLAERAAALGFIARAAA